MKVLIADDDRLVRTLVSDLLLELGHEVISAENGAQAVELCRAAAPDVLVLDLLMPRLSGLDAVRVLREGGARVPAVLLTAISDDSLRRLEGADAVDVILEKPVSRRALERALSRAVAAR